MSGPIFISEQAIIDLHDDLLEAHGGPHGMDYAKVCSVAAFPRQRHAYENPMPSVPDLAALYAFAASSFHAFTDGNKRVALALLDLFLMQNGFELTADQQDAEETILALARNEIGEADIVAWVNDHCSPMID